jgi:hypothetical protein
MAMAVAAVNKEIGFASADLVSGRGRPFFRAQVFKNFWCR